MQKNTTTHIILSIIAIALIAIVILLVIEKKNDRTEVVNEVEKNSAITEDLESVAQESETGLVTPPAPGIFSVNAVKNFTSNYNPTNRTFTFTANVMRKFFFEANAPVALYDQDGNLLEMKGATATEGMLHTREGDSEFAVYGDGDTDFMALTFTFVLPASESPTQQFVVRIMQDDPSGGEGGTPLYWGKVISGK